MKDRWQSIKDDLIEEVKDRTDNFPKLSGSLEEIWRSKSHIQRTINAAKIIWRIQSIKKDIDKDFEKLEQELFKYSADEIAALIEITKMRHLQMLDNLCSNLTIEPSEGNHS